MKKEMTRRRSVKREEKTKEMTSGKLEKKDDYDTSTITTQLVLQVLIV